MEPFHEIEPSFWQRSWERFDPARIEAYAAHLAAADDPILPRLKARGAVTVCDAGCGCGAYALLLAEQGFHVSGFDLSADAAALAGKLLAAHGYPAEVRAADVRRTDYPDGAFDAAVARDVLDRLPRREAAAALRELLRIVRPGGCVLLTLDGTDAEYESEPHERTPDGDYRFTAGKWCGMVFHPWTAAELESLTRGLDVEITPTDGDGFVVELRK